MKAGRELDVLVAEKVMGTEIPKWLEIPSGLETYTAREIIPLYSTDIAAAWQVIEKMNSIKMDTPEGYQLRAKWSFGIHGASIYNCTAEQAAHEICLWACRAYGLISS